VTEWKLYALGTPVVFVFMFCFLALRTRVGYYRTTKLSVFLTDITVFAALGAIAWLWSIKAGKSILKLHGRESPGHSRT